METENAELMETKWLFDKVVALIGNMSFVGPRSDVSGYADKLQGDDRDVLKLCHSITCGVYDGEKYSVCDVEVEEV